MLLVHLIQHHRGKLLSVLENSKYEPQFCLKSLTSRERRNKKETWPLQMPSQSLEASKSTNALLAAPLDLEVEGSVKFCSAMYLLHHLGRSSHF